MLRWQRAISSCRQRALGLGSCWADAYGCYTGAGQESAEYVRNVLDIPTSSRCFVSSPSGIRRAKLRPRPTETLKWEKIHIGRYQMAEEPTEEA